jgi:rhodanese-related sulfurtransferase
MEIPVLKALIKLPFKVALLPLKLVLKAAGVIKDEEAPRPGAPVSPSPSSYEPPPTPSVPQDLEVQPKGILERVQDGADLVFVDVRESGELAASGMIEGALRIPLRDLPRRYTEIQASSEVVLYCAAGMRSFDAAMFLRDKGFERAHSLIGGLPGWTSGGGDLVPL